MSQEIDQTLNSPWSRAALDKVCDEIRSYSDQEIHAYLDKLVTALPRSPQHFLAYAVFKLSGLAMSFGEPYREYVWKCADVTIEKDIWGVSNVILACAPNRWQFFVQHPDYLVRWCVLDCLKKGDPTKEVAWLAGLDDLTTFLEDPRPDFRQYARHSIEDRLIDRKIYLMNGFPKSDPKKKLWIDRMKAHRAKDILTFDILRSTFPLKDGVYAYSRAEADSFVASMLQTRGGNIVLG